MIHHKTTLSSIASYGAGFSGWAVGTWLSENWLQVASLFFMIATLSLNVYFSIRRDDREVEKHNADMEKINQVERSEYDA